MKVKDHGAGQAAQVMGVSLLRSSVGVGRWRRTVWQLVIDGVVWRTRRRRLAQHRRWRACGVGAPQLGAGSDEVAGRPAAVAALRLGRLSAGGRPLALAPGGKDCLSPPLGQAHPLLQAGGSLHLLVPCLYSQ